LSLIVCNAEKEEAKRKKQLGAEQRRWEELKEVTLLARSVESVVRIFRRVR